DAVAGKPGVRRLAAVDPLRLEDLQTRRCLSGQPVLHFLCRNVGVQLQLGYLPATDHPERQRRGEDQARLGIEALGAMIRERSAPQHALETPHEVVVTDQAQVAGLAKTDSYLSADHARNLDFRFLSFRFAIVRRVSEP